MLEIRPTCEQCNRALPYDSTQAFICSFECTYCESCKKDIFKDTCPNCGGGFVPRPIRPTHLLEKYPVSTILVHTPKNASQIEMHLKSLVK